MEMVFPMRRAVMCRTPWQVPFLWACLNVTV